MNEKKKTNNQGLSIVRSIMSKIPLPMAGSAGRLYVPVNAALNKAKNKNKKKKNRDK